MSVLVIFHSKYDEVILLHLGIGSIGDIVNAIHILALEHAYNVFVIKGMIKLKYSVVIVIHLSVNYQEMLTITTKELTQEDILYDLHYYEYIIQNLVSLDVSLMWGASVTK